MVPLPGFLAGLIAGFAFTCSATAQDETPSAKETKIELLCLIDNGIGGYLALADGSKCQFHVEAAGVRARLVDRRMPADAEARVLKPGSAEEARVLAGLEVWLHRTFTPDEQQELLAADRLPSPRTEEQSAAFQRATLLRTVRLYVEVTRPRITRVFAGRKTVTLSMRLQLGESAPQQVLWRRIDEDAFARMYLGTETEPVTIDSRAESRLLLGMANWLAAKLGGHDQLWAEGGAADDDVALVLKAYRGYLLATSPRLRVAGTIMDRGNGGSKMFHVSDARNRIHEFRFDWKAGTQTPGRLLEGRQLLDLGSEREAEALALLDRTARLRRRWMGENVEDVKLTMLERELEAYRSSFHDGK